MDPYFNYNHKGGTNPNLNARTTNLPVIGSTAIGIDESNSIYWGHAAPTLLTDMLQDYQCTKTSPNTCPELRYKAVTNAHTHVLHFKTKLWSVIDYIKTGKGTMSGIQSSFTKLEGHTTNLPGTATIFRSNEGVNALTEFPFYMSIYSTYQAHFSIRGNGLRWEVDRLNSANSGDNNYYQAWIR